MTRVVALEKGHDGTEVREQGEEFDVDLDDPRFKGSTWFVPLDKAPKAEAKKKGPDPRPPGAGPKPGSKAKADDESM
jgi:hypothetical protein